MVMISGKKRVKGIKRGEVKKTATQILSFLRVSHCELSLLLTDDEQIHRINLEYRGIDRPTDVIAFAMSEGEFPHVNENILGDVVISLDTAKRQAIERNKRVFDEVSFLLVHGILHLLGYDHETCDEDRLKMEKKEREIINRLETVLK